MTSRLQPQPPVTSTHRGDSVPVYHNSGPVPNNAYRTGAVGLQVDISSYFIVSTLLTMVKLAPVLEGAAGGAFGARLHPALIHGAACSALVQLDAPAALTHSSNAVINALASRGLSRRSAASRPVVDAALAAIGCLRDVLRDHQLLPPFHGLVSCVTHDYVKELKTLPWLPCHADDRIAPLAWGLVAIACASPPILLFTRPPSLMWFRPHHLMMVRWFGAGASLPSTPGATR